MKWLLPLLLLATSLYATPAMEQMPVYHGGRFRPAEAYAQIWAGGRKGALEQLWQAELEGEGPPFRALPTRQPGIWAPMSALQRENITLYSDTTFEEMQTLYLAGDVEGLAKALYAAYESLAGTPYIHAGHRTLTYPTRGQLFAEALYYRLPLIPLLVLAYLIAALLPRRRVLIGALLLHTLVLGVRCYILARPPVSNMFETLLYVPWVSALTALCLGRVRLGAIAAGSMTLLLLFTGLSSGMENVQAVLDSNLWLTIHVLMVVGSYGIFFLGAVLAHVYLVRPRNKLAGPILHTMYLGTGMLIAGTLLGGVWAAQSWGRFWDWDPKESWAFISILIYLVGIHLHRFRLVREFGLAMSACVGFFAISFTWYGVNYLLGTGLHSYGFGHGGSSLYLILLAADALFLGWRALDKTLSTP